MNILLVISLIVLGLCIFGIYRIYQKASNHAMIDDDYTIDIDHSIHDFLRNGGRSVRKTFGFIILSIVSLYKITTQSIKNNKLTQRIFDKIQL
jgi:hypothetical protein